MCVWQRVHLSLSFLSLVPGVAEAPVPSAVVRIVSPCQDQRPWFAALTFSLPVWAAESGARTCFRFLTCFWAARVGLGSRAALSLLREFIPLSGKQCFFLSVQKYMEGQVFALSHQKAFHDIPGPPHGAREEVLGGGRRRSWERFWRTRSVQVKSTSITKFFTKQRKKLESTQAEQTPGRISCCLKQTSKGLQHQPWPEMDPGAAGGWVEGSQWDLILLLFLPDVPEGQADEWADPDQQNHNRRPRFDPEQQVSLSRSLVLIDASEFRPLWNGLLCQSEPLLNPINLSFPAISKHNCRLIWSRVCNHPPASSPLPAQWDGLHLYVPFWQGPLE